MSTRIRVILLEDIADLGVAGDIVNVSEGYARNALFPNSRAALATEEHLAAASKKKAKEQQAEEIRLKDIQATADALDGTELTITARAKDGEEIFGTINASHLAKELSQQANLKVRAKDIKLPGSITKLGSHQATISFGDGIEANIQVVVKAHEDGQ